MKHEPIPYLVKSKPLSGTSYREVYKNAMVIYRSIKRQTKRKPYIKSAYFNKQKVFFDYFWQHLFEKRHADRMRRLKYFLCAVNLIEYSRNKPLVISNPKHRREKFYRFYGRTKHDQKFMVQIKRRIGSNLQLMSMFP